MLVSGAVFALVCTALVSGQEANHLGSPEWCRESASARSTVCRLHGQDTSACHVVDEEHRVRCPEGNNELGTARCGILCTTRRSVKTLRAKIKACMVLVKRARDKCDKAPPVLTTHRMGI